MSTLQDKGTAMPFPYNSEKAIAKHITQNAIAHIEHYFLGKLYKTKTQ